MTELVELRRSRMAAAEAARRMGVSRQQVYNLENMRQGSPSLASVERYAWAVGAKVVVKRLRSLPR
jgi:transcriptional regulator with XRE-family HTH domain